MPYVNVEVEVDLTEFDNDDLINEIESRGLEDHWSNTMSNEAIELIGKIFERRRSGLNIDQELDQLIYDVLGRIV